MERAAKKTRRNSNHKKIFRSENNHELEALRREVELLRHEIQENIVAIHRLEILTFNQRLALLSAFGKELKPSSPGKTKESTKPAGYSFGIITNAARPEKLECLIQSIQAQDLSKDQFEILVAGKVRGFQSRNDLTALLMENEAEEGRLGAMRNVLAKAARFNKFVCLDDDLLLHPRWVEAVEAVQEDFDLATGVIVNPDLSRYCDWVNNVSDWTFLRCYHEGFNMSQYVTGGYGIYKDYIFQDHAWREDLGFYQGEDVRFSRALFEAGYQLKFIPQAIVMHDDERYRQKGYGVIRVTQCPEPADANVLNLKLEKLCPRTV
jgi:glycosyltransferase involved in cell wall biosynthesis